MAHEVLNEGNGGPGTVSRRDPVRVGEQARPRMLIIGFDEEPDLLERLKTLAPTVRVAQHPREVNQGEFDLLVTDRFQSPWPIPNMPDRAATNVATHLSVVYRSDGAARVAERVRQAVGVTAGEFAYPPDLPPTVRRLVLEQLVPLAQRTSDQGQTHRYFTFAPTGIPTVKALAARAQGVVEDLRPFLSTQQSHVLAGRYSRSDTSECWVLPKEIDDLAAWVDAAIEQFHEIDPAHFPTRPGWREAWEWRTVEEQKLQLQLEALDKERREFLSEIAGKERDTKRRLAEASHAADSYERGLLTIQGDELPALVARVLGELGFEVTEVDATVADKAQLLEDLQVRDPDQPTWVALAEVRGYTGGAKTSDFQRIARFAHRYEKVTGEAPSTRWYIVNHLLDRDPAFRARILAGQEEDVAAFAEDHGLAIDTRQLFKLIMVVRADRAEPLQVRQHLRGAIGVLELPPSWETPSRELPSDNSTPPTVTTR